MGNNCEFNQGCPGDSDPDQDFLEILFIDSGLQITFLENAPVLCPLCAFSSFEEALFQVRGVGKNLSVFFSQVVDV